MITVTEKCSGDKMTVESTKLLVVRSTLNGPFADRGNPWASFNEVLDRSDLSSEHFSSRPYDGKFDDSIERVFLDDGGSELWEIQVEN